MLVTCPRYYGIARGECEVTHTSRKKGRISDNSGLNRICSQDAVLRCKGWITI
jgi:hypothetical protein